MVLYYSATGNTEYIAKELANALGDSCLNLLEKIKRGDLSPLHSETPFVICAPVIVCEMPRFLHKFLKELPLCGNQNVYFIFTSGGYSGAAGVLSGTLVKKKKMRYLGHADFIMPRNYVASDAFSMLSKEDAEKRILEARKSIAPVAEEIRAEKSLTARHAALWETVVTVPFNPVWCKLVLTSKAFHIEGNCVGCGKCVKLCPLNNISLQDKKPQWGNTCTHCMACICNCPTEAIEYGKITQKKEKYNFGKYRYITEDKHE